MGTSISMPPPLVAILFSLLLLTILFVGLQLSSSARAYQQHCQHLPTELIKCRLQAQSALADSGSAAMAVKYSGSAGSVWKGYFRLSSSLAETQGRSGQVFNILPKDVQQSLFLNPQRAALLQGSGERTKLPGHPLAQVRVISSTSPR